MNKKIRKVCVITAGHLSTCPRMIKAADTLAAEGYNVRVVSTRTVEWASEADNDIYSRRSKLWSWTPVDLRRVVAPWRYVTASVVHRLARAMSDHTATDVPFWLAARAQNRSYQSVVRAAIGAESDFFYGGGSALAATARAAELQKKPFALDLEDFHTAEQSHGPAAARAHRLMHIVQAKVLAKAAFLSAGSEDIALEYDREYGLQPLPINNTFPLPSTPPDFSPSGTLRLYWFSQNIGPGRGLEDAVMAMGKAEVPGVLTIRGLPVPGYLDALVDLAQLVAPRLSLKVEPPAPPDEMINLARRHDIGLALEQPTVLNRDICLTNKAFTYLCAGLAVAMTKTRGQQRLGNAIGSAALMYEPGDTDNFARGLRAWAMDPIALRRAKAASWEAAESRWHWNHPLEAGRLIAAVGNVLG